MSEPLFILGALWLAWIFLWGSGGEGGRAHPVAGPILFGAVLAVLLHVRVHAVAFAAAASLVALERDGRRAWPWIAACAAAGLCRVPLWIRWGGLVSPAYQGAHGLGLDLDAATYLVAATIPLLAVFLWPALRAAGGAGRRVVACGAAAGLLLALAARPDLTETMTVDGLEVDRYMGLVWGVAGRITGDPVLAGVVVGGLAVLGAAGLGALAACAWSRGPRDVPAAAARLQLVTLAAGCAMYGLTRSVVYDRYLLQWAILLPVVWVGRLGRAALLAEGVLLLLLQARFVWRMLVTVHPA
jgi:hypothetical protein